MRADIAERESEGTGEDLFVVKLDHEGSAFLNLHLKEVLIVLSRSSRLDACDLTSLFVF